MIKSLKKTVIITGGNSGLGYRCAFNLAKYDINYHVLIACRNAERAAWAVERLKLESKNPNVSYMLLDLASLNSVRAFVDTFYNTDMPPLYGIVCNAAGNSNESGLKTIDGFEATFGINHLGHFLLVNLLLPGIMDDGRIVFVSSDMHNPPKIFGDISYTSALDLAYPQTDKGMLKYAMSKLCNIYCAYELSKKLKASGCAITVNAFNPGMMTDTGGFSKSINPIMLFVGKIIAPLFAYCQGRLGSSEKSGKSLADIITDEKYTSITGKYIDRGVIKNSSALSYNLMNAEELWKVSEQLTGLE
jgi:NAD(P)-dependent dehydrogenase (short-subunit alcohol dehydrogenase family)